MNLAAQCSAAVLARPSMFALVPGCWTLTSVNEQNSLVEDVAALTTKYIKEGQSVCVSVKRAGEALALLLAIPSAVHAAAPCGSVQQMPDA